MINVFASVMFGAVGAIVTAAACDLKPVLMIAPNQIKSKMEVLNTVENWWRSQLA